MKSLTYFKFFLTSGWKTYLSLLLEKHSTHFYALLAWDLGCVLIITNSGAATEESELYCSLVSLLCRKDFGEALSVSSSGHRHWAGGSFMWWWGKPTERKCPVTFPFCARSHTWADQFLMSCVLAEPGYPQELSYFLPFNASLFHCSDDKSLFLLGGIRQKFNTFPLLMVFFYHCKLGGEFYISVLIWNAADFSE